MTQRRPRTMHYDFFNNEVYRYDSVLVMTTGERGYVYDQLVRNIDGDEQVMSLVAIRRDGVDEDSSGYIIRMVKSETVILVDEMVYRDY